MIFFFSLSTLAVDMSLFQHEGLVLYKVQPPRVDHQFMHGETVVM